MSTLAWGIIGSGGIARTFASHIAGSPRHRLVAVAARGAEAVAAFPADPTVTRHVGYEGLIADPRVEAVYVATPHPYHVEWAVRAAEAGKHLLVEKPMGMNWAEGTTLIDAARRSGVFLMEAFMYRCHPQTQRVVELIRSGAIGRVCTIQATFSYRAEPEDARGQRAHDPDLGGGGILDVGCYPVSFARLMAGAARGEASAEPEEVVALGSLGPLGTDRWSAAVLRFADGVIAQVAAGTGVAQRNEAVIYGSDGWLRVPAPWTPGLDGQGTELEWCRQGAIERIAIPAAGALYRLEADEVATRIPERQSPCMPWADSLGNLKTLDRWRRAIGLAYPGERPEQHRRTVSGRPLARRRAAIPRLALPPLTKPVSQLVLGTAFCASMSEAAALMEGFWEAGGNAFDTSRGYTMPEGSNERCLGWWLRHHGLRDEAVVIGKGGNAPNDTPDRLGLDLERSLTELQLDAIDLYLIHRDNEAVPAGEWLDALHRHWQAGRIRAYGVSNMSLPRLREAEEYARHHGIPFFHAVSNQLSLARMLDPIWDRCQSAGDAESLAYFAERGLPLLPWSSQARGFFAGRGDPRQPAGEEMRRCWIDPANRGRRERCHQLATDLGVDPTALALAWVLQRGFPTFPIIGPASVLELDASVAAIALRLEPQQLAWLDDGLRQEQAS